MISIQNLDFHFGSRTLYEEASLHIKPKDRIGLIGANGTGKSTLLRLITGEYSPDGGTISKAKDCSIGFLNQDLLSYKSQESILSVALQAFERLEELQEAIEHTLQALENEYSDELVTQLTTLQEEFEALDGYAAKSKAEEILEGLGFATRDLERPLHSFSGGWRMRVMLSKLLLQKPALLMLDEPTNHLDLPSIQWLENYLSGYEGAVIIVSHDKDFINNACNKIVEVSQRKLNLYAGNYDFYVEQKALRQEIQQSAFENQQDQIRHMERFIERFRSKASKARQVQSRVKALEKIDLVEEVIDESVKVNFKFTFRQASGRLVAEMKNIRKAYGDLLILDQAEARIERGDKIALIGANGRGKSTLLRIIAGTEPVQAGEHQLGHNVKTAFYAQHQLESLNLQNDLLQELKDQGSGRLEAELRTILGCFLFSGDEVFKKIKVLSGGEKARVALAKMLVTEANFLLLDEPTNHLDMQSINILIQSLRQYEGTFAIVSHDRYFVRHVANKIWYIEDHQIKEYLGGYDEFEEWYAQKKLDEKKEAPARPSVKESKKSSSPADSTSQDLSKAQKALAQVEQSIEKLEKEKRALENQMALPETYEDANKLPMLQKQYGDTKQQLAEAQEKWDYWATIIDELQ